MTPTPALKLNVLIAVPAYGGNGGISSEIPAIRQWMLETVLKMKDDPRICHVAEYTMSDTPITMVRNRFITHAREIGAHLLLMVDSDVDPNRHTGDPWFKPFWNEAFNAVYDHYGKGPLVVGAPYCGPPDGTENVYVFQFDNFGMRFDETRVSLDQYTRAEAFKQRGIQEVSALPTGMILYDMRAFELIEPSPLRKHEVIDKLLSGEMTKTEALAALEGGWFRYEYMNQYEDEKASTEDVVNTRDIALAGCLKLGYNPIRCAWDSWVGHMKPWNVGKPSLYSVEQISATYARAVEERRTIKEAVIELPKGRLAEMFPDQPLRRIEQKQQPFILARITPKEHVDFLKHLINERHEEISRMVRFVEVGTWMGETAKALVESGRANVLCVDNFMGDIYRQERCCKSLSGTQHVKLMVLSSLDAADVLSQSEMPDWEPPFDIVFLDDDHTYEHLMKEIKAWWPLVAEGGILCGHDFQTFQFPGVERAVRDVFGKGFELSPEHGKGQIWVVRKPANVHSENGRDFVEVEV